MKTYSGITKNTISPQTIKSFIKEAIPHFLDVSDKFRDDMMSGAIPLEKLYSDKNAYARDMYKDIHAQNNYFISHVLFNIANVSLSSKSNNDISKNKSLSNVKTNENKEFNIQLETNDGFLNKGSAKNCNDNIVFKINASQDELETYFLGNTIIISNSISYFREKVYPIVHYMMNHDENPEATLDDYKHYSFASINMIDDVIDAKTINKIMGNLDNSKLEDYKLIETIYILADGDIEKDTTISLNDLRTQFVNEYYEFEHELQKLGNHQNYEFNVDSLKLENQHIPILSDDDFSKKISLSYQHEHKHEQTSHSSYQM